MPDHPIVPFEPLSAAKLATADLPLRPPLLAPVIGDQSMTLLLGSRGVGKSYTALGIAWAIASGASFLGWKAERPQKVLYVDGELPGVELQRRLKAFGPPPEKLDFVIDGIWKSRKPDLSNSDHWQALWARWDGEQSPSLVVLDSLSSLIGGAGNEAKAWTLARRLMMNIRISGRSVLLVHAGSSRGDARGGRHREDVFDTILSLRRPNDYHSDEGLRYELHFEKARNLTGANALSFEVRMEIDSEGRAQWRRSPIGSAELQRVAQLLNQGLNPLQAAHHLGISKSKAYRLRNQLPARGRSGADTQ